MRSRVHFRKQRGMTLLIGLIVLVMLLLIGLAAHNLGRTNTAVVGNMQNRIEATGAAMQAVEQLISTSQFVATPDNAVANSCGANTVCVDVNGDSKSDVTVRMEPKPCIKKIQVIKNAALDLTKQDDVVCSVGVSQSLGVQGAASGDSLCAASVWEVTADATDAATNARSVVVTGVSVRVLADEALDTTKACP